MRKLATVRKIDSIAPIDGADAIEVATVGGWKVVVKKNEFQPGNLAIYFEIDSWIPNELAPFLTKNGEPREYNGVKGERLRTVKLRGQISQGLLLPLSFHPGYPLSLSMGDGQDLTESLNIQKYEPPIPAELAGDIRGNFPGLVPKTDQERVQNLVNEINDWQGKIFEVTEKLDGCSCTYYLDEDQDLHVCSRNLDLKYSETNTFWRMAVKHNIREKMIAHSLINFAIQGEIIGPGIQGNKYKLKDHEFYVFDMYDVRRGEHVQFDGRSKIAQDLNLPQVPVLGLFSLNSAVEQLLKEAEGKSVLNNIVEREGVVYKCASNSNIHFKVISNRFLLKDN